MAFACIHAQDACLALRNDGPTSRGRLSIADNLPVGRAEACFPLSFAHNGFERAGHLRTLLTTLAILVILVLTAALVGPAFVDWSRHRAVFESQLSRLLGQPVHVAGRIGLRLLPSPRLELGTVRVGAAADAPVTVEKVRLEMALSALLRGSILLTDATFVRPTVRLTRGATGEIVWPFGTLASGAPVQIDKLALSQGRLVVADAVTGASVAVEEIALGAEVSSLSGPFRGNGSVGTPAGPVKFRFSTNEMARRQMPVKLVVSEAAGVPHAIFDGALDFSAVAPSFRGTAAFDGSGHTGAEVSGAEVSGAELLPWTLAGAFEATADRARLRTFELRVGSEQRFIAATGSAELDYATVPKLRATLAAKTVDIDRQFAGRAPGAVVSPRAALAALRQIFDDAAVVNLPRPPLSLDFTVGLASIGGDALRDVAGSIAFTPGQPLSGKVVANGPGESRVALDGTFDVGVAPKYQGHLDLAAAEWPRFAAWAAQGDARTIEQLAPFVPFKTVALTANAEISGVGFALQELSAKLDRSRLAGTLAFTAPVGGERARLSAYLTADALDIDRLPDIDMVSSGRNDLDLALDVTATSGRIAGVADAGRIELKLDRTAGSTVLDRLRIAGLSGASVDAHGRIDPRSSSFEGHLDAADLAPFAGLVRHFLPESLGSALVGRAAALSPAKLDVKLRASPRGEPELVSVGGSCGGTRIDGSLDGGGAGERTYNARLRLDADDTGKLLRQLGMTNAVTGIGGGSFSLSAKGPVDGPLDASVTAKLAGTAVAWRGRADASGASIDGPASVRGADLVPLLRSLGLIAARTPALAADMTAVLHLRRGRLGLRRLAGMVAGTKIDGQAALSVADPASAAAAWQGAMRLTGTLNVDKLTLAHLATLVLGPTPTPAATGGGWSTQAFAASPASLPQTQLALRVAALDIGLGIARDAPLDVGLRPGEATLRLDPAAFRGGTLGGEATLRRSGGAGSLNGRLAFAGLGLGTPYFRGKLDGRVEFAGTGDSPRALVAGLAGQGRLSLIDAELTRLDPGAVDRVVAAVDAETVPLEAVALDRALKRETGRKSVTAKKLDLPILLAAGVARLGPADLAAPRAEIELSGLFDLAASRIEVNEVATLKTPPAEWLGPPPRLTFLWKGPWERPERSVDAATFLNGLSARALAINLQKLEEFDADVRERAFFNRRLKVVREHAAEERRAAEAQAAEERRRREEKAAEARRLEEMIRAPDLPPVGAPVVPPPRPGG